jgi:hypothetical protein
MKKTGPTPFLRKAVDPDSRIQDYHEKLLCEDCEQIFSEYEGKFASHVFYPHVRDETASFEYGEWMYRFVLSISWRLLVSKLAVWKDSDQSNVGIVEERIETWREILLDEKPLSDDPSEHHIFLLDELDLVQSDHQAPDNFEMYMQRNIDGTSVFGEDEIHVFFKFPKVIFFSTITPTTPGGFVGTKINSEGGTIEQPQELGEKWGSFLMQRVEKVAQVEMSEGEQQKVKQRIKENPEKLIESDFLEAQISEMRRQFAEHDILDYLNESTCPVCYTNHRIEDELPTTPLTKSHVETLNEKLPFVRGTFPPEEEVADYIPVNLTDNLIVSTEDSTNILQFFPDHGWIVAEEIEHVEEVQAEVVGEEAYQHYKEEFEEWIINKHGKNK